MGEWEDYVGGYGAGTTNQYGVTVYAESMPANVTYNASTGKIEVLATPAYISQYQPDIVSLQNALWGTTGKERANLLAQIDAIRTGTWAQQYDPAFIVQYNANVAAQDAAAQLAAQSAAQAAAQAGVQAITEAAASAAAQMAANQVAAQQAAADLAAAQAAAAQAAAQQKAAAQVVTDRLNQITTEATDLLDQSLTWLTKYWLWVLGAFVLIYVLPRLLPAPSGRRG